MPNKPSMIDIMFDPEKYGYEQCQHCNGYGSSLKETAPRCTHCGGSGLIRKPKQTKGTNEN